MTWEGIQWDYTRVTYSGRDEDGFPIVQGHTYGNAGEPPFSLEHQYGFYSRPHDPTDADQATGQGGGFCTLIVATDGSTSFGFLGFDPRIIPDIPLPPKGSSMQYAAFIEDGKFKPSFMFISGDDGTLQFYRPAGDSALSVTFGVDGGGQDTIELRHPDGSMVSMFDGSIVLRAPGGGVYIQVSDDGIVLRGPITAMGGMSPPGGVQLAKSDPVLTVLGNLLEAVGTLGTAIAAVDQTTSTNVGKTIAKALPFLLDIPTQTTRGS